MKYINMSVNGMRLRKMETDDSLIVGSRKYIYAKFRFDDDWTNKRKAVVWKTDNNEEAVLIKDGIAPMPDWAADEEVINLYVAGQGDDGQRIVTNSVRIMQKRGV